MQRGCKGEPKEMILRKVMLMRSGQKIFVGNKDTVPFDVMMFVQSRRNGQCCRVRGGRAKGKGIK